MSTRYLTALTCVVLSACGGGSSDSPAKASGSETVTVEKNTFSVTVVNRDACGNEQVNSQAQLIIHNEDFTTKAKINPSTDGSLSYESVNENEHISVLYKMPENSEGFQKVNVETYVDQPIMDVGEFVIYTRDASTCTCDNSNFSITRFGSNEDSHTLRINNNRITNYTANYEGFDIQDQQICRNNDGQWSAFSATVLFPGSLTASAEAYAAYSESLAPNTDVEADIMGVPISVNVTNADEFDNITRSSYSRINDEWRFYNNARTSSEQIYYFPAEDDLYSIVRASHFSISSYQIDGVRNIYLRTSHMRSFQELDSTIDLTLPVIDNMELINIGLDNSFSYDFSQNSDFDYFNFYLSLEDWSGEPLLSWSVYTPTKSKLPNFDNIDIKSMFNEAQLADVESAYVDIELTGFEGIDGYQDYLRHRGSDLYGDDKWLSRKRASVAIYMDSSAFQSPLKQSLSSQSPLKPRVESAIPHRSAQGVMKKQGSSEQRDAALPMHRE